MAAGVLRSAIELEALPVAGFMPAVLSRDDLELMVRAGCVQISYGVQHFSWRMLKIMGRREEPIPLRRSCDTLELGMQSYVDIILGHPVRPRRTFRSPSIPFVS